MYNHELEQEIHDMFQELSVKAKEITCTYRTARMAAERISEVVASRVSSESGGYVVDMYSCLVGKIKENEYFEVPEHLNAFYRLNLREEINNKYQFEIALMDTYKKGIDFKDVRSLYAAAGAAAGTVALGGILKYAIAGLNQIPIAVIIAGAVVVGIATYFAAAERNKQGFHRAVDKFLDNLENEVLDWLTEIERYFDSRVRSLYND